VDAFLATARGVKLIATLTEILLLAVEGIAHLLLMRYRLARQRRLNISASATTDGSDLFPAETEAPFTANGSLPADPTKTAT